MDSNQSTVKIECSHCGCVNKSNSRYCKDCGYELPRIIIEKAEEPSGNPTPAKKRISWAQIVGIATSMIVIAVVQQVFFKPKSFDKAMMQWASEINKTCPIMVDQETRLDNTIALPDRTFQYNYTLVNMEKSSIDVDEFIKIMEPMLVKNIQTNPDMKIQRDYKTTLKYYYKDKEGNHITTIAVTTDKYK